MVCSDEKRNHSIHAKIEILFLQKENRAIHPHFPSR